MILSAPQADKPLPSLRQEMRLLPASANHDGSPAWMVQDPVNNRFFRIGWIDFEVLLRWHQGSAKAIADSVNAETTLHITEDDVFALVDFLNLHTFFRADTPTAVDQLKHRAARLKKNPYEWLLHNYLFFRVPLIRPQQWLIKLLPWVDWLFSRTTAGIVVALSLMGLFLAARQWETFVSTAVDHMTWSGILGYTVALVLAKTLHEMGHAITATRYGVRVAHMGVAMLVLFPMLYTDTSESWKLTKPRQRLAIASAGIISELGLAGLATFAWCLVPDGAFRNALFFLATTSWFLTLLLNASPFMRFDGYFILTDVLDFPNLHERGDALARTWIRRTLLGFEEPWPERTPGYGNAGLITFTIVTWVYRLGVFLGIALLVYHFAFKLLGIFLMLIELVWFIARPVWGEIKVWIARKTEIKLNRRYAAWIFWVGLVALVLVPWSSSVQGVGWVHPERHEVIYAPLAGKITSLGKEGSVKQGDILFAMSSPDLQISEQRATALADARGKELLGLSGFSDGEDRRAQLQTQQDKFVAEAQVFEGEHSRLKLAASFTGVLSDQDSQLMPGVWVKSRQPLAVLLDPTHWVVDTYVSQNDVERLRIGDSARARMALRSMEFITGHIVDIDQSRTVILPHSMLDAKSGGPVATLGATGDERRMSALARDPLYRVQIALDGAPRSQQMLLANVVIEGKAQAWLPSIIERIVAVAIRESGF